jgi:glycosyltransferase involved in cell wall biosynthesis
MKRVLVMIHTPVFGGLHNLMIKLYEPLRQRGWELTVLTTDEPGNGAERLQAAGISVELTQLHRMRKNPNPIAQARYLYSLRSEIAFIRDYIRSQHIDLVHICGLMNIQAAFAASKTGTPIVWQLNSTFAPPIVRKILSPLVCRKSAAVLSEGQSVADAHPGVGTLGERLHLFFPGVDVEVFRPDAAQRKIAREEMGVRDDQVLIGAVGNRNHQKGHDFLVRAAAIVREKHPDVAFRILGAHTPSNAEFYQREVLDKAEELGLLEDGFLQFIEPGNRVPEFMPGFDIFALTSRAEGVATATLEAMATGLPLVVTDVGSLSEVVTPGENGYLARSGDPVSIAEGLSRLIVDGERRATLGVRSRELALARFTPEICADAHANAYENALAAD